MFVRKSMSSLLNKDLRLKSNFPFKKKNDKSDVSVKLKYCVLITSNSSIFGRI